MTNKKMSVTFTYHFIKVQSLKFIDLIFPHNAIENHHATPSLVFLLCAVHT